MLEPTTVVVGSLLVALQREGLLALEVDEDGEGRWYLTDQGYERLFESDQCLTETQAWYREFLIDKSIENGLSYPHRSDRGRVATNP